MKQLIFSLIGLVVYVNSFGQMNAETANKIKESTLSIKLTGIHSLDSNLVKAIKNYWSFTRKYEFVHTNSSNNDFPGMKFDIQDLTSTIVDKYGKEEYSNTRYLGSTRVITVEINNSKVQVGFSKSSDLTYLDIVESIKRLQFTLSEIILEGGYRVAFLNIKNKYGKELKDKTLLVDNELVKKNLDVEAFKSIYPYHFKFTDKITIEKAILQNDSSKAYIVISEEGPGLFLKLICDTENGKIYAYKHPLLMTKTAIKNKKSNRPISISDLKKLSKQID